MGHVLLTVHAHSHQEASHYAPLVVYTAKNMQGRAHNAQTRCVRATVLPTVASQELLAQGSCTEGGAEVHTLHTHNTWGAGRASQTKI